MRSNRAVIELAPLQVYSSALIFAPKSSEVRKQFVDQIPNYFSKLPEVEESWSSLLQTLEGHSGPVNAVVFSSDGKQLASASSDETVWVWDAATGMPLQTLKVGASVRTLSFSSDGSCIETDFGRLGVTFPQPRTVHSRRPQIVVPEGMFVKAEWIMRGIDRILWLPPDYRPSCRATHGNVFGLGHHSGRVSIFQFAF